jgi:hypothetical protein
VPVYCYNLLGGDTTSVRGNAPLTAGTHELMLDFHPDAQGGATVVLTVDGTNSTKGTIPKLAQMLYEASDGFSVGLDQGSSVSPETVDVPAAAVAAVRFEFTIAAATKN